MEFRPGTLVELHDREWVVLPSPEPDLMLLRPLGGSELETRAVWKKILPQFNQIKKYDFKSPVKSQIGDFSSARLLFNATRLSFRNGAGPFRSMGKLSFRPRAYQLVTLIMALRQKTVRLLIADDVGIGKTIEALLIAREMLDRAYINGFAVLCPPHLCEQWQQEIFDKFSIEAKIVRSSTLASLEKNLMPDETIFEHYPFTVISIDLVKNERYRKLFLNNCPSLVICDEAHTCAKPEGQDREQQLRHRLLADVAEKKEQHILLLTATPHSGKQSQFQSLLGLLQPEFEKANITDTDDKMREEIAKHFVQRRRKNIVKWLGEETIFPERSSVELPYELTPEYQEAFNKVLKFARTFASEKTKNTGFQQLRYYAALTLLRGIMSSPASGASMLNNRADRKLRELSENPDVSSQYLIEQNGNTEGDFVPSQYFDETDFSENEIGLLRSLGKQLNSVQGLNYDSKAKNALKIIKEWLTNGFNPIVYCRFIDTAKYLGEVLGPELKKVFKTDFDVQVVTSELSDEERKEKVDLLKSVKRKVIFATDCMSEGINLQEQFTGVIHYDLPWNPNRLEQREGRVDRYGQQSPVVKTLVLYCKENPVDGTVWNVLLKKTRQIRKDTGIAVPFPEESETILQAVLKSVLLKSDLSVAPTQGKLDFGEDFELTALKLRLSTEIDESKDHEVAIASIFAQRSLKPEEIEGDLRQTDEALGTPENVQQFVLDAVLRLSGSYEKKKNGFLLQLGNTEAALRLALTTKETALVSFESPTPEGHVYLGRNHHFVEQLCQMVMKNAFQLSSKKNMGRVAVIRSLDVREPQTVFLLRIRNVISDKTRVKEYLAEEVYLTGYISNPSQKNFLTYEAAKNLIGNAVTVSDVDTATKEKLLEIALNDYTRLHEHLMQLTSERSNKLVDAHERFRKAIGGEKYKVVEPVLPPDLLGIYIILPPIIA